MKYTKDLRSKSGKDISILVFEASKQPKATIIESHGGFLATKEKVAEDNKKLIDFALENNINYVAIDLSNNGSQKDQPVNEIRFSNRVKDVETVIDYTIEKYKSRIILIGSSLGGLITLNSVLYSSNIKGIILNCAAVKADECVEATIDSDQFKNWKINRIANVWGVSLKYDFYEDLVKLNALKIIPHINVPILWFHGTNDEIVPITQAREAKLTKPDIKLVEINGGKHRFGDAIQPGEWEQKVEFFILSLI